MTAANKGPENNESPLPDLRLSAEILHDDSTAWQREWLVTNGLGGYGSAAIAGMNTRRYHGLFVPAMHPPLGRAVLLSKLDETLLVTTENVAGQQSAESYELTANFYPGVTHPQGYHLLESWSAYPAPTWIWSPAPGIRLEKRIWMPHGRNASYIAYRLLEAPPGVTVKLRLAPLLAWKDYHSEMHAGGFVPGMEWTPPEAPAAGRGPVPGGTLRLTMPGIWQVTAGWFDMNLRVVSWDGAPYPASRFDTREAWWYYRMHHPREQERGQDCEEDLYSPGAFYAPLAVGQALVVTASVEETPEAPPESSWSDRTTRLAGLCDKAAIEDESARLLALAADAFLIQAPNVRATIIAGYPWFSDWGRDTMISLPGLTLSTGRVDLARDILRSFSNFVDGGMLPNRFPDQGEIPEYNTVDATLWYFVAIYRYVEATGDVAFVHDDLWGLLEEIVACHQRGTRYNIHVDPADNLLYAGQPGVQLTWMDAKVGDWVVTPRIGKPVEINALWYNALRCMACFAEWMGDSEAAGRYGELARKTGESFNARFPRPGAAGLFDVLDTPPENREDATVRPNQIFALSMPFAPVEAHSELAASILEAVEKELLTPFGLRTLSYLDPAYRPRYEGDALSRDGSYHQGTVWPWLLGPYVEAHFRAHGDRSAALELLRPLCGQLTVYGVSSLSEIYDGGDGGPQRPNGCIAQAWSVAETLRVLKIVLG